MKLLKYVSITNIIIEHYMQDAIRQYQKIKQAENKKQQFFERLYRVVFEFFVQKYTRQNNTFWCGIISRKKHDAGGLC